MINDSLFYSNVKPFCNTEKYDGKIWAEIYNLIPLNAPLVDRCQYIKMPYDFKLFEKNTACTVPTDLTGFDLSYEQCSEKRVNELYELSKKIDKPITIFYSGGIDSTFVVASFMKYLSPNEFKDRVRVAMTLDSIHENYNFYYNYIRPYATIISSEPIEAKFDKNSIIVSGEHNDQLFGSDLMAKVYKQFDNWDVIAQPYSRGFLVDVFFNKFLSVESSNYWFDLMDAQIKNTAPCEIKTNFDFFWWYNFNYKWQSVYFRMLMGAPLTSSVTIDDDFLNNYYFHFFSCHDFQKWSMLNHHLKIKNNDWSTYKWECKKLIYEFNKDSEYLNNKFKMGSLLNLYLQKKMPIAFTSNYEFIDIHNIDDFYVADNSFKNFGQ